MSVNEATNNVNTMLNQIDRNIEVIPFNNLEKFIALLEFIKGSTLEKEERDIAKNMITAN